MTSDRNLTDQKLKDQALKALAKQELDANGFESCLLLLREKGIGKYTTGTIMAAVLEEPIQAARARVHWSKTWQDVRARDALYDGGKYLSRPEGSRDDEEMD